MSLHTYDFDVSQAPGPRLLLEEGVSRMQQRQQQASGSFGAGNDAVAADDDAQAPSAAAAAAAQAAALARQQQQQHQQRLAATSFRARGSGRYPSRADNRLDAAALLAATGGGDADDDAETFSARPYSSEFEEHPDLAATWAVDRAFLDAFAKGFNSYRMGAWEEARAALGRTLQWPRGAGSGAGNGASDSGSSSGLSGPPDGPSAALLRFMEAHKFVPPKAWRGFRELTEK